MNIEIIEYFNVFDYILLLILVGSVFTGVSRGMIKETCNIIGWLSAIFLSYYRSDVVAYYLYPYISYTELANLLAIIIIFLLVVLIFQIIGWLLSTLIRTIGLGIVDRLFGVVLGFVRGFFMVSLLIFVVHSIFGETTWMRESVLMMYFVDLISWTHNYLPDDVVQMFKASEIYEYIDIDRFKPIVASIRDIDPNQILSS